MLGPVLIFAVVGIIFLVLGLFIWKKEKIELLHSYHRDKVKEEDKKAFCKISGIGTFIMGAGMIITAVIVGITESVWSFAIFAVYFIVGLAMLIIAGAKYNK